MFFLKTDSNFFKTSDGEQIFYSRNFTEVDDSKPVLVFNYGLVCSNHHWKYQLSHFDTLGYQILIHDYRGHFQSSGKEHLENVTFNQIARDIYDLCHFLNIKQTIMLGHSMGVNICLQIAKNHPEMVKGMILISGTFMPVKDVMFDSNIMEFITPVVTSFMNSYPLAFKKIWTSSGGNPIVREIIHTTGFNRKHVSKEFIEIYLNRVGQLGPEMFFQLFSEMGKQNISSSLDRMNIPALVMGGSNDNVIPNHLQRTLASLLPKSETYFMKGGSHVPQADFPDLINERMDLFINQNFNRT
jgi:non-heme chloroperoxidase